MNEMTTMTDQTQPSQGLLGNIGGLLSSPAGMGLLAAGFGALSSRNPWVGLSRGGQMGLLTYADATQRQLQEQQAKKQETWQKTQQDWMTQDRIRQEEERKKRQTFLDQVLPPQPAPTQQQEPNSTALEPGGITPSTQPPAVSLPPQANHERSTTGISPVNPIEAIRNNFSIEEAAQLRALSQPQKPSYLTAKPGEMLIDPLTMKPVFSAPKESTPTEVSRLISEMESLPKDSPQRALYEAALRKTTTHAPGTNVNVSTGQKGLDNEFKLRGEFKGEPIYKAHQEMDSAYRQIKQSLGQANPAGDLAGATKLMKLLDPGSVVRESELGMAMQASGLMDRLQNYGNMVITGEKLTPTQRKEFQELADALYGESIKQFNGKRSEYERLGSEFGLNASRALGPSVPQIQSLPKLPQQPVRRKYNPQTGKIE